MQLDDGKEDLIRLQEGPVEDYKRHCTDKFCLASLFIFASSLIAILIYCEARTKENNILKITQGFDVDHKACGIDYQGFPYIYFIDPTTDNLWKTVCVAECPLVSEQQAHHHKFNQLLSNPPLRCAKNSLVSDCSSVQTYNTAIFDNRVCLPSNQEKLVHVLKGVKMGFYHQYIHDIYDSKWTICLFIMISLVIGFLLLYLLRWCSKTIMWFIIILIVCISIFFGYYSYEQYRYISQYSIGLSQQSYLFAAFVWFSIGIITIILTVCFYKRINLSVAIIRCASDFLTNNPNVLLSPLISFILTIIFTVALSGLGLLLYQSGTITTDSKALPFNQYKFNYLQHIIGFYLIFCVWWTLCIIIAGNNFIISGCSAIWYWQQAKTGNEHINPVSITAKRLFRFHLGTIGLGSFLLGIVSIFRVFFEYLYRNAEYMKNTEGCKFCFKCCTCCIWCFERFLQFLNQNAYVQTNMTGEGFLFSAKNALDIMGSNISIVMSAVGLGDLITNISRLLITLIVAMSFYKTIDTLGSVVVEPYNPTTIVALFAFMSSTLFIGIFGAGIESILHLYCIDEEIGKSKDEHQGQAQMCPASLKEFLNEQVFNQKI